MRRTIAIVLIIAGVVLLAGSAMAFTFNRRSETTSPRGAIDMVIVRNQNGRVNVRVGDTTRVQRTETWNFVRPRYREDVSDGVLQIRTDCSSTPFNNCGVTLELVVPRTVDVTIATTNGDVGVNGISAELTSVSTTNGDVRLDDLDSDSIRISSKNGDLALTDVESRSVSSNTTNGDIDVELGTRPDSITLASTNGDIDATLPKGDYDIQTATTNGDVSVEGLDDDSDSPRRVSARTTNGDIDIRSG